MNWIGAQIMHSLLLLAAEPLTVENLNGQGFVFAGYTFLYGALFFFMLYIFLKQEVRSLKRAVERSPERAMREALDPLRADLRQNHMELLKTQPATKETILTYEVNSLKRRLDEMEKKVATLLNSPEEPG
jgi:hypothetical protein